MPLTQDRLLQLLLAAEAYEQAYERLKTLFSDRLSLAHTGQIPYQQVCVDLAFELQLSNSLIGNIPGRVLERERVKYEDTKDHNAYQKTKQEIRRRNAGIKPRQPKFEPYLISTKALSDAIKGLPKPTIEPVFNPGPPKPADQNPDYLAWKASESYQNLRGRNKPQHDHKSAIEAAIQMSEEDDNNPDEILP